MSETMSVFSTPAVRGAYGDSQALSGKGVAPAMDAPEQTSFAEMVGQAASDAVSQVRQADVTAQAGIAGVVGTQQVVEATIAMESTVKIAVSMRDKLVAAYQEILRMPI